APRGSLQARSTTCMLPLRVITAAVAAVSPHPPAPSPGRSAGPHRKGGPPDAQLSLREHLRLIGLQGCSWSAARRLTGAPGPPAGCAGCKAGGSPGELTRELGGCGGRVGVLAGACCARAAAAP
ncbi:hypothetical protein V8C86DRAFT_2462378, partial [Haematococcus lacustris]